MIKNATIFKIPPFAFKGLEHDALSIMSFAPTGPTQEKSVGWVPPRGEEHGSLVEAIKGALVFKLKVETRKVPAATLADELAKACKHIEATTGRKPGKKEKRDMKEELVLGLLPKAFPTQKTVLCIADGNRLILGTTSTALADDVLTALVRCGDDASTEPLRTATSPTTAMAQWLVAQEPPVGFAFGRAAELKSTDESKAKVRYTNHPLLTEEVQTHIVQGKVPTSLALEFDDRVSFVLTDGMQLKKIDFGDAVMEQARENGVNPGDFDGSMVIAIGELRALMPDLLAALGGEAEQPVMPAAQSDATAESSHQPIEDDQDPMYQQAVDVVLKNRKASISLVQRHLVIGYNRAARLLEAMEAQGVVSRMDSSGHRTVLLPA